MAEENIIISDGRECFQTIITKTIMIKSRCDDCGKEMDIHKIDGSYYDVCDDCEINIKRGW